MRKIKPLTGKLMAEFTVQCVRTSTWTYATQLLMHNGHVVAKGKPRSMRRGIGPDEYTLSFNETVKLLGGRKDGLK